MNTIATMFPGLACRVLPPLPINPRNRWENESRFEDAIYCLQGEGLNEILTGVGDPYRRRDLLSRYIAADSLERQREKQDIAVQQANKEAEADAFDLFLPAKHK